MRDGRELVGWGMATGIWEAHADAGAARARVLTADGKLEVAQRDRRHRHRHLHDHDADRRRRAGPAVDEVRSSSATRAAGGAGGGRLVDRGLRRLGRAGGLPRRARASCSARARRSSTRRSQSADARPTSTFADGTIALDGDPARASTLAEAMQAGERRPHRGRGRPPSRATSKATVFDLHAFGACSSRCKVDEELGAVRVTRVVGAVAAGRIINPKTARSQILGGIVWGIGMALQEETLTRPRASAGS